MDEPAGFADEVFVDLRSSRLPLDTNLELGLMCVRTSLHRSPLLHPPGIASNLQRWMQSDIQCDSPQFGHAAVGPEGAGV